MKSLDMSAFTVRGVSGTKLGASNSHLYDLAAVIVHHGSGYAQTSFFMLILHTNSFIRSSESDSFIISFNESMYTQFYILIKSYRIK